MKTFKIVGVAAALLSSAVVVSPVQAGEFNMWSYSGRGTHDVIVGFAGDGKEQEAQIDLDVPAGLTFAKAEVLVAGSVCASIEDGKYVRAVPPSGAGKALPAAETDYCKFSFTKTNLAKAGGSLELTSRFVECSEPGGATKSCGVKATDVSENAAK